MVERWGSNSSPFSAPFRWLRRQTLLFMNFSHSSRSSGWAEPVREESALENSVAAWGSNLHPNLENLARVHEHLHRLGLDVVYVGGATIGLYLDPFGASRTRPTKDVDCIVPIEARSD